MKKKNNLENNNLNNQNNLKKAGIWIVLSIFLAVFIFLIINNPSLIWDENVYLGNARNLIGNSNFTEDFRFPLLEYILAGVWLITGESIFVARLVVALFSLFCLLFFYLIFNLLFKKEKLSLFFTILFGLSNLFLFWGFRVYADIPSLTLILISMYFALKSQSLPNTTNANKCIIVAGIFSSLAFLMRFSAAFIAISIFFYLLFNKDYKKILLFIVSSIIILIPWMVYNWIIYQNLFWDLFYYQSVIADWTVNQPITKELTNIWNSSNYLLLLFLPGIAYSFKEAIHEFSEKNTKNKKDKKDKKFTFILIYLFLSLIYYTFFVRLKDERYVLTILPIIFIISYFGFFNILQFFKKSFEKRKKGKNLVEKFLYIFLIFLLIFNIYTGVNTFIITNNCSRENAVLDSIKYIDENNLLNETDIILSNFWPPYAYHFNVQAYSLWKDLEGLVLDYHPRLLIIKENDGTTYNLNEIDSNKNIILINEFNDSCNNKVKIYSVKSI